MGYVECSNGRTFSSVELLLNRGHTTSLTITSFGIKQVHPVASYSSTSVNTCILHDKTWASPILPKNNPVVHPGLPQRGIFLR